MNKQKVIFIVTLIVDFFLFLRIYLIPVYFSDKKINNNQNINLNLSKEINYEKYYRKTLITAIIHAHRTFVSLIVFMIFFFYVKEKMKHYSVNKQYKMFKDYHWLFSFFGKEGKEKKSNYNSVYAKIDSINRKKSLLIIFFTVMAYETCLIIIQILPTILLYFFDNDYKKSFFRIYKENILVLFSNSYIFHQLFFLISTINTSNLFSFASGAREYNFFSYYRMESCREKLRKINNLQVTDSNKDELEWHKKQIYHAVVNVPITQEMYAENRELGNYLIEGKPDDDHPDVSAGFYVPFYLENEYDNLELSDDVPWDKHGVSKTFPEGGLRQNSRYYIEFANFD